MILRSFSHRIIPLAAWLVPSWRRSEWMREWGAELEHMQLGGCSRAKLSSAAVGALADAFWLRIHALQIDLWWSDLRLAVRHAARRPAFALLVTITIALGLGAAGAVFAMADAVLLRPLAYKDPARLVFVWHTLPEHNVFEIEATPFDYRAWHEARSLSSLALIAAESFTLTGSGDPERVHGCRATASLFSLLGIAPGIGRGFEPAEDTFAAPPVVILSDGVWRRRFAADAAVLGRSIEIDGIATTVVGVMPPRTYLPGPLAGDDELWLPMRMGPAERDDEIGHNYTVVGRLADGVSLAQASAEMSTLAAAIAASHPDTHKAIGVRLVPVPEQTVRGIRPAILVLLCGVALLVTIASANVITLLLAEASSRRQELAVRAALGAGRARLVSLAVTESLVLAAVGGLGAVTFADWAVRALLPAFADALPPAAEVAVDARTAMATMGAALVLGIGFGALVAAHRPAGALTHALRSGGRISSSRGAARTRNLMVIVQVALAIILLAGSGVMVRSFVRLADVQPGFEPGDLLTFRLALPAASYSSPEAETSFVRDAVARLVTIPGIAAAAVNTRIPFGRNRGANGITIEGRPAARGDMLIADQREVTAAYFQTVGMRVIEGRGFTDRDDARSEPVAIVNRAMAQRFWPGASPIDGRVRVAAGDEESGWLKIVGIVNDVHHIDLSRLPVPELYRPFAQMPLRTFTVLLRTTTGDPTSIAPLARRAISDLDAHLPLYDLRTMASRIADSVAKTRGLALLLFLTAVVAAMMAAVAIYGSIWYSVTQRIPEIGVRLALGATRRSVCILVVTRALATTAIGAAAGFVASIVISPMLGGLLFDTRAVDPGTYGVVLVVLALLSVSASLAPARRAMRVDPLTALRAD
jgi:putative ABC transport system permease protein